MGHQTERRTKRTTSDKGHLLTLNTAHFIATAVARQEDILTSCVCVYVYVFGCVYVLFTFYVTQIIDADTREDTFPSYY